MLRSGRNSGSSSILSHLRVQCAPVRPNSLQLRNSFCVLFFLHDFDWKVLLQFEVGTRHNMGAASSAKYTIDADTYDEAALKETFGDQFDEAKYAELKDDEGFVSRAALETALPSIEAAAVRSAHDNADSRTATTPADADAATGPNAAAANRAALAVRMKEVAAGGGGLNEDGKAVTCLSAEDTGVDQEARGAGDSGAGVGEEVKAEGEAKAEIKLKKSMSLCGAGLTLVAVTADHDPDMPLYIPTARGLRKSFLCTMQKDLLKAHSTGDMLADAVREVQKGEMGGCVCGGGGGGGGRGGWGGW